MGVVHISSGQTVNICDFLLDSGYGQRCGRGSDPHCDIVLGTTDWAEKRVEISE